MKGTKLLEEMDDAQLQNHLNQQIMEGARKLLPNQNGNLSAEIQNRLSFEKKALLSEKASRYLMLLKYIAQSTIQESDCWTSPYGTIAGSLVCYCLGITRVNPLEYNLLFERFFDLKKQTMPEVYLNVENGKKKELVQYLKQQFGGVENTCDKVTELTFDGGFVLNLRESELLAKMHKTWNEIKIAKSEELNLYDISPCLIEQQIAEKTICFMKDEMKADDIYDEYQSLKERTKELPPLLPLCMQYHLRDTYGILLYQEQLMLIAQDIARFNPMESNEFRKALCKRKYDLMEEYKERFFTGGLRNGYMLEATNEIWQYLYRYSLWCVNKSHFAQETLLHLQYEYLKEHYPTSFNE